MGAAGDLQNLAADVLQACVDILQATNGSPERAYVSHGPPVFDCCPQLAVSITNIGEAASTAPDPFSPGLRKSRINLTGLAVTIAGCHPTVDNEARPPDADALTAAAAALNDDAWALWCGLWRMRGDLFGDCEIVFFDGMVPIVPEGGCAGWVMAIRFELPGYEPLLGS